MGGIYGTVVIRIPRHCLRAEVGRECEKCGIGGLELISDLRLAGDVLHWKGNVFREVGTEMFVELDLGEEFCDRVAGHAARHSAGNPTQ